VAPLYNAQHQLEPESEFIISDDSGFVNEGKNSACPHFKRAHVEEEDVEEEEEEQEDSKETKSKKQKVSSTCVEFELNPCAENNE
jgi:hypothetical protein